MPKRVTYEAILQALEEKGCVYIRHYYATGKTGAQGRTYLKIDYYCKNGHLRENMHFQSVRRAQYACEECTKHSIGDRLRLTLLDAKKVISSQEMEYISGTYENNISPLTVKCVCGNIHTTNLMRIRKGNRCGCQRGGVQHYNYNPEMTDEERRDRRLYPEYTKWVKAIFEKDDYTCQKCKKRGGELHAHHIYSYTRFIDRQTDVDNGATLCEADHKEFHRLYGRLHFTAENFYEYVKKDCN